MADDPLLSSLNDDTLRNAQAIGDSMVEAGDAARRLNTELRASSQLMVDYATTYSKIKTSANAVAQIQDKAKVSARAVNDATREQAKNLTSVRELNAKIEDLYRRARRETGIVKEQLLGQARNLAIGRDNAQGLADLYGGIARDAASINSQTTFFNEMSRFVEDIPGLRVFSKPFQDAAKAARETVLQNSKILQNKEAIKQLSEAELRTGRGLTQERLRELGLAEITNNTTGTAAATLLRKYQATNKQAGVLGAGMKTFAKSAASGAMSFVKTGGWIGIILGGLKQIPALIKKIVDFLLEADERAAKIAIGLNMSKLQAAEFSKNILRAATGTDYLNTRLRAAAELAVSFANNTGIISTNLRVFNADLDAINRRLGLSEQQTAEIAKNMILSGQTSREFAISVLGSAEALEMQTGINIQNQAIMRDIADLTATQYLNLDGQPDAIARAVTQARRFGMTMSLIEGTQSSLLNFGQSITDELNAELLLGRELNLDRARLAALDNNYAVVAEEIASQIGDAASFSKLHYFQQEALAKAVGMTKDQLTKVLKEQDALVKAGFKNAAAREEEYENLKKTYGQQEALRRIGMQEYTRLKNSQSVQEQINNLLDNMRIIFLDSINESLQKGVEFLAQNPELIQKSIDKFRELVLDATDFVDQLINGGPVLDTINEKIDGIRLNFQLIKDSVDSMLAPFKTLLNFGRMGKAVFTGDAEGYEQAEKDFGKALTYLFGVKTSYRLATGAYDIETDAGQQLLEQIKRENAKKNSFVSFKDARTLFSTDSATSNTIGPSLDLSKGLLPQVEKGYTEVDGILYPSSAVNGVTTTPLVDETGASVFKPKKEEETKATSTTKPFTKRSASIEHTNWLLSRLIEVVERGGDVYLDGRKITEAQLLSRTRQ